MAGDLFSTGTWVTVWKKTNWHWWICHSFSGFYSTYGVCVDYTTSHLAYVRRKIGLVLVKRACMSHIRNGVPFSVRFIFWISNSTAYGIRTLVIVSPMLWFDGVLYHWKNLHNKMGQPMPMLNGQKSIGCYEKKSFQSVTFQFIMRFNGPLHLPKLSSGSSL